MLKFVARYLNSPNERGVSPSSLHMSTLASNSINFSINSQWSPFWGKIIVKGYKTANKLIKIRTKKSIIGMLYPNLDYSRLLLFTFAK